VRCSGDQRVARRSPVRAPASVPNGKKTSHAAGMFHVEHCPGALGLSSAPSTEPAPLRPRPKEGEWWHVRNRRARNSCGARRSVACLTCQGVGMLDLDGATGHGSRRGGRGNAWDSCSSCNSCYSCRKWVSPCKHCKKRQKEKEGFNGGKACQRASFHSFRSVSNRVYALDNVAKPPSIAFETAFSRDRLK
jgi:hypothetical protein